jgi:hypothetical protein
LEAELVEYLRNLGAVPVPSDVPSEEASPDFSTGVTPYSVEPLAELCLPEVADSEVNLRFFLDGVQRTVPLGLLSVKNLNIPVYIAHLIAGVMERRNRTLAPFLRREVLVFYIPLEGMRNLDPLIGEPPYLHKFDQRGNIYDAIRTMRMRSLSFWTDISVPLSLREIKGEKEETILGPSELSAIGAIRRAARTRSKVLLRVMELGVLWEVINNVKLDENDFIVVDGPVFLPLKYARLTSTQLASLIDFSWEDIADVNRAYSFYRHVIGAVKNVRVVPTQGLTSAFSQGPGITTPIYLFSETVKGADDEVSRHTISAFIRLRRELSGEISPIWSPASELSRIDIPLPAIVGEGEPWYTSDFRPDLSVKSSHRQRLEAVLKAAIRDRWPIPETTPHRMLTEYYCIAETENWLKSHLLPEQELRSMVPIR